MSNQADKAFGLNEVLVSIALEPVGGHTAASINSNSVSNLAAFNAKAAESSAEHAKSFEERVGEARAVQVTKSGQKLVNHYIGGYHYFTVAQ